MLVHCVFMAFSLAVAAQPVSSSSSPDLLPAEKTEASAPLSAPVPEASGDENSLVDPLIRAVQAAERAALAAQKAAEATQRIAHQKDLSEQDSAEPVEEEKLVKAPASWTGSAGISLIALFGSANSITVQTSMNAARETRNWISQFTAAGTYGQTSEQGGKTKIVAMDSKVSLRGDYRFSMKYSGFILVGLEADHIRSIEARPYEETGLSIIWLDKTEKDFVKARIVTDTAFRFGREMRFQYYDSSFNRVPENLPDEPIVAPSFRASARYALDKNVVLTQEVDVQYTAIVVDKTRTQANSKTKLTARLISSLGVAITYNVNYDSRPAPGKQSRSSTLSLGLETSF